MIDLYDDHVGCLVSCERMEIDSHFGAGTDTYYALAKSWWVGVGHYLDHFTDDCAFWPTLVITGGKQTMDGLEPQQEGGSVLMRELTLNLGLNKHLHWRQDEDYGHLNTAEEIWSLLLMLMRSNK